MDTNGNKWKFCKRKEKKIFIVGVIEHWKRCPERSCKLRHWTYLKLEWGVGLCFPQPKLLMVLSVLCCHCTDNLFFFKIYNK